MPKPKNKIQATLFDQKQSDADTSTPLSVRNPVADYTNPNSQAYKSVSKLVLEALNTRTDRLNNEELKFDFIKIAEKSNVTCVGAFVIYSHMSKFIEKDHRGKWILK